MPQTTRLVSLSLAFLTSIPCVTAQITWTDVTPAAGGPGPMHGHAMVYDAARGQTLLFGGHDGTFAGLNSDTWAWDGTTWTLLASTGPSPRQEHAMAYDETRQTVVLFGGRGDDNEQLADTWEWNGTAWTQPATPVHPSPREGHAMAYLATAGHVVLFGGIGNSPVSLDDTWLWDGNTWVQAAPDNAPLGRTSHLMAHDSTRGHVVLYGGNTVLRETWLWDGTDWTLGNLSGLPFLRENGAIAFDATRGQAIVYGGNTVLIGSYPFNTFAWSGVWVDLAPPQNPGGRENLAMAYDAARDRMVMHGGFQDFFYSTVYYGDTWELAPYTPPAPYTQPQLEGFGLLSNACNSQFGPPATISSFGGLPWIGENFDVNLFPVGTPFFPPEPAVLFLGASRTMAGGVALPYQVFPGLPGCLLRVSPDLALPVMTSSGGALWSLALPDCAACVGLTFYMQGIAIEQGALVFGTGLTATLGER